MHYLAITEWWQVYSHRLMQQDFLKRTVCYVHGTIVFNLMIGTLAAFIFLPILVKRCDKESDYQR